VRKCGGGSNDEADVFFSKMVIVFKVSMKLREKNALMFHLQLPSTPHPPLRDGLTKAIDLKPLHKSIPIAVVRAPRLSAYRHF
jgi:hypothetical protein